MRSVASVGACLVMGAWCLLHAPPSHAQPSDEDTARALFEEGKSLLARKRTAEACPKLEQSLTLVEAGGTALNLARCRMMEGRLASAWRTYGLALTLARKAGRRDREQEALLRMNEIEPLLSRLTIHAPAGAPADVSVFLDGVALPAGQLDTSLPVDGGPHRIEARAVGWEPSAAEVDCPPRQGRTEVHLPPLALRPRPAEAPPSEALPQPLAARPRLAIRFAGPIPQGGSLFLDAHALPPDSSSVGVSPGLHRLELRLEGHVIWSSAMTAATPVTTVEIPALRKVEPPTGPRHPYLAYGVGGLAAVSLLASSAFALDAVSKRNEVERMCPDLNRCSEGVDLNDRAGRSADYATVGLVTGLAGAAAFTWLLAIDRHPRPTGPSWEVAPMAGNSLAGLHLMGASP